FYNKSNMYKGGREYLQYITDTHIPAREHPLKQKIPEICRGLIENKTPILHMVDISHCWRNALFEIVERYDRLNTVSSVLLRHLSARIYEYERHLYECYTEQSEKLIHSKDITIRELHEDRIQLIGKMAASMAHEIRNPLTSIRGFLKLLRTNITKESLLKVERYIRIIEDEFENINMQITGLLSFSKNRIIEETAISISVDRLVESVLSLLDPRLINEDIHLVKEIDKSHVVTVQKIAVQQVISNVINNGVDALTAVSSPRIMKIFSSEDDRYIYLWISNNGPEIMQEMKEVLFTPFVTDKIDGTGLGLAICQKIMSSNQGSMSYTSYAEETTFIISFLKK
ncbi:MAG TPA: HAMP domain-containing sensor histidine kinase, partial [Bacilli bacterium]